MYIPLAAIVACDWFPNLQVTEWYEADQLPVRSGVYEMKYEAPNDNQFRYFDGANWYAGGATPDDALRHFQIVGGRAAHALRWRGLTERVK